VLFDVRNVVYMRVISQIAERVVRGIAIIVTTLHPGGAITHKRGQYQFVD
jgi:hypothetical protein